MMNIVISYGYRVDCIGMNWMFLLLEVVVVVDFFVMGSYFVMLFYGLRNQKMFLYVGGRLGNDF